MDIDKVHISKVVAETFFEDHVLEWKATGLVPKQLLLQQPSVTNPVVVNPPVPVVRVRKRNIFIYFAVDRKLFLFLFFSEYIHTYYHSVWT